MRLYFDECCSRRLPRELKEFFTVDYPDLITCHVLDFYNAGTGDSTWLKPLQEDRRWIVITGDLGRDTKKEKLPLVCMELGITHVAIAGSLNKGGYTKQKSALVAVWAQLLELSRLPPGTQVKLGLVTLKGGVEKFELRVAGKSLSTVLDSN